MSGIALAVGVAGTVVSKRSADKAVGAQTEASDKAVEEQRRQFDALQKVLQPFTGGGQNAFAELLDMTGANGPEAEATAIDAVRNSPEFAALAQEGEEAILANASATGGLRGGNVQGALGQFRPSLLSGLINQRFSRLLPAAQLGQASAAQVGSGAVTMGNNVGKLLLNRGEAIGQGHIATGNAINSGLGAAGFALNKYITGRQATPVAGAEI